MKGLYNRSAAVLALFVLVNGVVFLCRGWLERKGLDVGLLLVANLVLFLLSLTGFFIMMQGLRASSTFGFLRSVYMSLLLKLLVVIVALFGYLYFHEGRINRPALFSSLGLYVIYMVIEIRQLMRATAKRTDG